jgi:hypothetical protein
VIRRVLLAALLAWPATAVWSQEAAQRPRHKISAAQLHEALSARFPVQLGVEGLIRLEISAPSLHLRPARNQLGAGLLVTASGMPLQAQPGEMDVVFSLRYERSDQTVRALKPEVLALRWPGLPPDATQVLQRVLPGMAAEGMGEIVLYQFTQQELALPATMGFEPERLTVQADGLLVEFGPRRRG